MPSKDDWFEAAGREVEETPEARKARVRMRQITKEANRLAEIKRQKEFEDAALRAASPGAARAAAGLFTAVAAGAVPPVGAGVPPRSFSSGGFVSSPRPGTDYVGPEKRAYSRFENPEEGIAAIVRDVKKAHDHGGGLTHDENYELALKKAGEWMTRLTNAVTEALAELDQQAID